MLAGEGNCYILNIQEVNDVYRSLISQCEKNPHKQKR